MQRFMLAVSLLALGCVVGDHAPPPPAVSTTEDHVFAGKFHPQQAYLRGKPVLVELAIQNIGPHLVHIDLGGRYRLAGRNNRFSFRIVKDGRETPTVHYDDFGGAQILVGIEPGGVHREPVDLHAWCSFGEPGRYEVQGSYENNFYIRDGPSDQWNPSRQHEVLNSTFEVVIEP